MIIPSGMANGLVFRMTNGCYLANNAVYLLGSESFVWRARTASLNDVFQFQASIDPSTTRWSLTIM
jgi:hypothetical protein